MLKTLIHERKNMTIPARLIATSMTITLSTLSGCSNQDDANKGNFQSIIQHYYDSQEEPATCIAHDIMQIPFEVTGHSFSFKGPSIVEQLGALLAADLLELTDQGIYLATDIGRSAFRPEEGGFCFGKLKVNKIINFTKPKNRKGLTISKVTYTVTMHDRPDWSKTPLLVETFGLWGNGLRNTSSISSHEYPEKKITLVKIDNGWITEHETN